MAAFITHPWRPQSCDTVNTKQCVPTSSRPDPALCLGLGLCLQDTSSAGGEMGINTAHPQRVCKDGTGTAGVGPRTQSLSRPGKGAGDSPLEGTHAELPGVPSARRPEHGWEEGNTESRAATEPHPQRRGGTRLAFSRDCRKLDVQNVGNGQR